jgi:hypothetical protein
MIPPPESDSPSGHVVTSPEVQLVTGLLACLPVYLLVALASGAGMSSTDHRLLIAGGYCRLSRARISACADCAPRGWSGSGRPASYFLPFRSSSFSSR